MAGRVDADRSNPLDYRDTAGSVRYALDDAELAYEAQQEHDLAGSEFQLQESDSQWAIATADQVYDRLTTDKDSMFPGEGADPEVSPILYNPKRPTIIQSLLAKYSDVKVALFNFI